MYHRKSVLALLMAGGLTLAGAAAAGDIASPAMLANSCAACHGPNGSSVGIMPSIAGTPADYFVDTMNAFKDGSRKATVMDRIAKGYNDDEIKALAGFFAKQRPIPQEQPFDPKKATLGRKLHADNCERCHENGGSTPDEGGILAGQSMTYLQYTFEDFREKHREVPRRMRAKVEKVLQQHGPAGMEAIMHYYASQYVAKKN